MSQDPLAREIRRRFGIAHHMALIKIIPRASLWHVAPVEFDEGESVLTLCLVRTPALVRKGLSLKELMMTAPICEGCMEEFLLAKDLLIARRLLF